MTDITETLETASDPIDLFAKAVAASIESAKPGDMYSEIQRGVRTAFEYGIKNDIFRRGVFEAGMKHPDILVGRLIDGSGRVVESQTNAWVDGKVVEVFSENEGEFKAFVKDYVRENMDRLVIAAVARVITDVVTDAFKHNSAMVAGSVNMMIHEAFQNARLNTGRPY